MLGRVLTPSLENLLGLLVADKLGLAEVLTLLEVFMQGFHVVRLAVDIFEMLGMLRGVVVRFVDERH